MQRLMDRVFARYGASAQVDTATGKQNVKVFFRSVKSEAWQNAERMFASIGEIPRGRYLCILPAGMKLAPEATLTVHGQQYLLRRIEQVAVFEDVVCQWCLCVEKGGAVNGT